MRIIDCLVNLVIFFVGVAVLGTAYYVWTREGFNISFFSLLTLGIGTAAVAFIE